MESIQTNTPPILKLEPLHKEHSSLQNRLKKVAVITLMYDIINRAKKMRKLFKQGA